MMAREPDGYYRDDLWDSVDVQVQVLQRETERRADGEEPDEGHEAPPGRDDG